MVEGVLDAPSYRLLDVCLAGAAADAVGDWTFSPTMQPFGMATADQRKR